MRLRVDEPTSPVPEMLSPRTLPSFNSLMSGTRLAGWQESDIHLQALVVHSRGKAKPKVRYRGRQPSMTMRARNLGGTKGGDNETGIDPAIELPLADMYSKKWSWIVVLRASKGTSLHGYPGLLIHLKHQSDQTYLPRRDWHGVGENGVDENVYQLLRHRYAHHLPMSSSLGTDISHVLCLDRLKRP